MQPDPVDSTKMVSAADHGWDEQDQYESVRHKDRLLRLEKIAPRQWNWDFNDDTLDELDQRLDKLDELEQWCKQQLERLPEQKFHDSLQRNWDFYHMAVIKERLAENGRHFKMLMEEHNIKEAEERHKCKTWLDNLQQSLGKQGPQPLPADQPLLRRRLQRRRRQTLHRELLLSVARNNDLRSHMKVHKFSVGVDTNNAFPSTYVPNSVRKFYLSPQVDNQLKANDKPVISLAYAKGNLVRKNIFVISNPGNEGSSSEGTRSTLTGGNNNHSETIAPYNDMPEVIFDNQAHVNCTGNFNVISNLNIEPKNVVLIAANGAEMETFISGSVDMGNFILPDVHYCPDLGNRIIVSGSILDNDDYGYEFGRGKFTIKDLKNDTTVGEGRLVDGNYILDYLKITGDRTRVPQQPGLVTTVWNVICSALHRLGMNPQGPPM